MHKSANTYLFFQLNLIHNTFTGYVHRVILRIRKVHLVVKQTYMQEQFSLLLIHTSQLNPIK